MCFRNKEKILKKRNILHTKILGEVERDRTEEIKGFQKNKKEFKKQKKRKFLEEPMKIFRELKNGNFEKRFFEKRAIKYSKKKGFAESLKNDKMKRKKLNRDSKIA